MRGAEMGKYWRLRGHENLDKAKFRGIGRYEVPAILPDDTDCTVFLGFKNAKYCRNRSEVGVHFFVEDDQMQRLWTNPEDFAPMLKEFKCLFTPDFSLYTDYPLALQIWNHYRSHWLGAYWQSQGLTVIPTISWSDETSYSWCFDGCPIGSAVAVSSVRTQMSQETKTLFLMGYRQMMRRLHPSKIFFQGVIPEGCTGNIVPIDDYWSMRRAAGS